MDKSTCRQWAERAIDAITQAFPNAEYENWKACDRLIAQAKVARQLIDAKQIESETASLLLVRVGYFFEKRGRYSEAEPLQQQALAMRKQLLGDEHLDVGDSLNNLALLYNHQGRYGEAEPLFQEALAIYKRLLGDEHLYVAISLTIWHRFTKSRALQ
jgi:tetratricopeptide (TPR) repeat protein